MRGKPATRNSSDSSIILSRPTPKGLRVANFFCILQIYWPWLSFLTFGARDFHSHGEIPKIDGFEWSIPLIRRMTGGTPILGHGHLSFFTFLQHLLCGSAPWRTILATLPFRTSLCWRRHFRALCSLLPQCCIEESLGQLGLAVWNNHALDVSQSRRKNNCHTYVYTYNMKKYRIWYVKYDVNIPHVCEYI